MATCPGHTPPLAHRLPEIDKYDIRMQKWYNNIPVKLQIVILFLQISQMHH